MKHHSYQPFFEAGGFLFSIVLLVFILLPLCSAAPSFTFKQSDLIDLKVSCFDVTNAPCLSTTTCNITINYPNMSNLVSNQPMNYNPTYFNYSLIRYQTTPLGIYTAVVSCVGANTIWTTFSFEVTPTGTQQSTSRSISNTILFVVSFIVFMGFLLLGIYLPGGNKSDAMTGYIIAVSNIKYLKLFFLALAYLTAMFISYLSWMTSYAYLEMTFLSEMFRILFYTLALLIIPLFILSIYFVVANLIRDTKVKEMLLRGFEVTP